MDASIRDEFLSPPLYSKHRDELLRVQWSFVYYILSSLFNRRVRFVSQGNNPLFLCRMYLRKFLVLPWNFQNRWTGPGVVDISGSEVRWDEKLWSGVVRLFWRLNESISTKTSPLFSPSLVGKRPRRAVTVTTVEPWYSRGVRRSVVSLSPVSFTNTQGSLPLVCRDREVLLTYRPERSRSVGSTGVSRVPRTRWKGYHASCILWFTLSCSTYQDVLYYPFNRSLRSPDSRVGCRRW